MIILWRANLQTKSGVTRGLDINLELNANSPEKTFVVWMENFSTIAIQDQDNYKKTFILLTTDKQQSITKTGLYCCALGLPLSLAAQPQSFPFPLICPQPIVVHPLVRSLSPLANLLLLNPGNRSINMSLFPCASFVQSQSDRHHDHHRQRCQSLCHLTPAPIRNENWAIYRTITLSNTLPHPARFLRHRCRRRCGVSQVSFIAHSDVRRRPVASVLLPVFSIRITSCGAQLPTVACNHRIIHLNYLSATMTRAPTTPSADVVAVPFGRRAEEARSSMLMTKSHRLIFNWIH